MYREIKIGDEKVPMLAMASAGVYYKQIFGDDIIKLLSTDDDDLSADRIWATFKIGYVMAMFARFKNGVEMRKLNEGTFCRWLDDYSNVDMLKAVPDILALYTGQQIPDAVEKKEEDG